MIGVLPEALIIDNEYYSIRADYRNVLQVLEVFQDLEHVQEEKWIVTFYLLFEKFSSPDDVIQAAEEGFNIEEAVDQVLWFISAGQPEKEVLEAPTYSWKQDEQIIFAAVNKVAGREIRELEYLHWWTFLCYFYEIGEGTFSFVVGIRHKLNKGKKLEKHEKEFLNNNKRLVKLDKPKTKKEQEQEEAYQALLDEVLG